MGIVPMKSPDFMEAFPSSPDDTSHRQETMEIYPRIQAVPNIQQRSENDIHHYIIPSLHHYIITSPPHISNRLYLNQQVWMRQLMHGNSRSARAAMIKKSSINFIITFKILHIHKESSYIDQMR